MLKFIRIFACFFALIYTGSAWSACNKITLNYGSGTDTIYVNPSINAYVYKQRDSSGNCLQQSTVPSAPDKPNAYYRGYFTGGGTQCSNTSSWTGNGNSECYADNTILYAQYDCYDGYTGNGQTETVSGSGTCAKNCIAITLNNTANSGTGGSPTTVYMKYGDTKIYSFGCSSTTSITTKPTKTNATLGGWYTASGGGTRCILAAGNAFVSATACKPTGDTTYYARYTCDTGYQGSGSTIAGTCTASCIAITLDNKTNGGSTNNKTVYKLVGSSTLYSNSTCTTEATITAPEKTNAKFAGYYIDSNNTSSPQCIQTNGHWNTHPSLGTVCAPTSAITYYAIYNCEAGYVQSGYTLSGECVPGCYTITVNSATNGGSGGVTTLSYKAGSWYTTADCSGTAIQNAVSMPTKTNASFIGFYTTSTAGSGTQCFNANGVPTGGCTPTSNTTYYSRFQCAAKYQGSGSIIAGTCTGTKYTCAAGKYLRASDVTCQTCPAGKYCNGGTFTYNGSDQGINGNISADYYSTCGATSSSPGSTGCLEGCECGSCYGTLGPNYPNSDAGATSVGKCYVQLTAGQQVASAGAGASACSAGRYCTSTGKIYYNTSGGTAVYTGSGCGAGTRSDAGATSCTVCSGNTYSTGTANASCTACTTGYVISGTTAADHDAASDCKISITLSPNGGSGTITSPKTCSQGVECDFGSASGLTQTGYTFKGGWGTSASCTATTTKFTTPTTTTYYACKSANTNTITLNKNGGTGTCGGQAGTTNGSFTCTTASSATLPAWNSSTCNLTKSNSLFKGWSTSSTATSGSTGAFTCPTSSTTYYAVWQSCTACTKGTGVASCSLSVTNNACSYSATCSAGYITPTCTSAGACSCSPGVYTITLNKNGSATNGTSTVYEKYATGWSLTNFGTTVTSITVPSVTTGYTFRGYYTTQKADVSANDSTGTQRITKAGALPANTTFTANTTLYAAWAKNCTTPANGSCSLSVADNGAVTYTTSCSAGYTISGNGTATPTCTANGYTVTYKAGTGGSGADQSQSVTYGSSFTTKASNTFSKTNATFAGWSASSGSYTSANTSYTYSTVGNVTLTATWNCNAGYTLNSSTGACDACADGTYKAGVGNGACSACSALNSAYTKSDGQRNATSSCYLTTTSSNYVATAKAAMVTCAAGGACPGNIKVYYGSTGGRNPCEAGKFAAGTGASSCTACATGSYNTGTGNTSCTACTGKTTSGTGKTSCDANCSNAANVSAWETASWTNNSVTNLCKVKTCTAATKGTGAASATVAISNNACVYSGTCSAKYVKPTASGVTVSCTACPTAYPNSTAGNTYANDNYCYLTLTAGQQVATAGAGASDCAKGKYCTSTANIFKGTDGGTTTYTGTACQTGSYQDETGKTVCKPCAAGKTNTGTGNTAACTTACTSIANIGSWATTSWSNGTVSNLCTVSTCAANSYKSGNTCPTCSSGTSSKYTLSAAGSTSVNSCYLTLTTGKQVATAGAGASDCAKGKYCTSTANIYYGGTGTTTYTGTTCVAGSYSVGGTSSCTACGAGKTSAAGATAASECTSCTAIANVSTWATSTWNSSNNTMSNLCTVSTCAANSYKSGNTCPTCSSGTSSKYTLSAAGSTSVNSCYLTLTAGKQVAAAGAGATDCAKGKYCTSTANIYYGGTGTTTYTGTACQTGSYQDETGKTVCKPCAAGKTNTGTGNTAACTTACTSIANIGSWATTSWSNGTVSNLCTVSTCAANSYKSGNTCPTCASGTNNLYAKSAAGTTSVDSCYLTTTSGNYVKTAKAGQETCPANSYCTGSTTIYYGTGTTTGGSTTCTSGTSSKYTLSASGSSSINSCYLTLSAGYQVASAGAGKSACAAGKYCTSTANIYYGGTGTTTYTGTNCPAGTYSTGGATNSSCTAALSGYTAAVCDTNKWSAAGAGSCTACTTANGYGNSGTTAASHANKSSCTVSCAAGKQVASAGAACTTPAGSWYTGAHSVAEGSTSASGSNIKSCATGYATKDTTTQTDHDASTDCTITCNAGTRVASANATCTTPSGNWYTASQHTVAQGSTSGTNCASGYSISGTATTDHDNANDCKISCNAGYYTSVGGTCAVCPAGKYCNGGTTNQTAALAVSGNCPAGTYSTGGATSSACTAALSGYTAEKCANWSYSTGGASACTACPGFNADWVKADSTGTGWTSHTSCAVLTKNVPSGCTAGQKKWTAGLENGSPSWGNHTETITVAYKAQAGYHVSGTSCVACGAGTYQGTAGSTATSCTEASKGYYVTGTGKASQTACEKGKYQDATGQSSCKSCPTLTSGYSYTNTTGLTAVTSCTETKAASGYCYGGALTKTAKDASTWNTATSTLTAKAGSHLSGSGDSTTCEQCGAGTYQGTNGSSATSCTICGAGTYNTTAGNSTCTTCPAGKYCTGGQNNTDCPAGKYRSATGGKAESDCSLCSSLTGVSVSGGTYTSAAGSTANTACKYTAPSKTITGCSSVTSNQVTYTGSAWPTSTYAVSASGGYIIANNNSASATCTQCAAGTFSAGGSATSCGNCTGRTQWSAKGASSCSGVSSGYYTTGCNSSNNNCTGQSQCGSGTWCASGVANNCSSLPGVSPSGGTYSSAAGSTVNTACKYTAPSKTITGCSSVTSNTVTYSGSAWPASTYNVSASGGYVIANNGKSNATCTQCTGATYSAGGAKTTCDSCPTAESGWEQGTGAGWSLVTQCTETTTPSVTDSPIATICTAGTLTKHATNSTTWGTATASGLKAKSGRYVNGTTCSACAAGYYQATNGSTATSCTAADKGYYVTGTEKASQTACEKGKYQDATGQSSCKSCPTLTSGYGYTNTTGLTAVTSCTETKAASGYCYGGALTKTAKDASTWNTATSTLTAKAGSHLSGSGDSTTCEQCTGATYQSTNGSTKTSCDACPTVTSGYTLGTGTGWTSYSSCYETKAYGAVSTYCASGQLKKTAKDATSWNAAESTLTAKAGSILSGSGDNTTCSQCSGALYSAGGSATSCTSCPTAESGWSQGTGNGWSAYGSCYETKTVGGNCSEGQLKKNASSASAWPTTADTSVALKAKAGSYVNGQTCSLCSAGTYQGTNGSTATSCTAADKGYYASGTGNAAQTACAAGTYTSATGQASCTDAVAGTYTTGCQVTSNNTACTGTAVCGANSWSNAKASSCTACSTAKGYTNSGTTAATHAGQETCTVTCGGGSYVATAGAGCTNVGAGYWGVGGTANEKNGTVARNQCENGLTTIGYGAGADEAADCGRILHVGSDKVYLRSVKKTTPSLRVKIGDTVFYGNMTPSTTKGKVRIKKDNTTYSVYDDSM